MRPSSLERRESSITAHTAP